jgi:hypothetical protein
VTPCSLVYSYKSYKGKYENIFMIILNHCHKLIEMQKREKERKKERERNKERKKTNCNFCSSYLCIPLISF